MMETFKLNLPVIILILLLFAYAWNLVRSDRINTQIGVSWLLGLAALAILCSLKWPVPQILARVGYGSPLLGMAVLGIAWLALLILNNHARISTLTVKLKLVSQELALLRERIDVIESIKSGKSPDASLLQSVTTAKSVTSPQTLPLEVQAKKEGKSVLKQVIGCTWIVVTVYAFAVFTGFIQPQGSFGNVLTTLFASLKAEYLH